MRNEKREQLIKAVFIFLGTICLILAYIGIVMPGIPGTPFILLTVYFYVRSSDRLYHWILKQKIFAKMIKEYEKNDKIPLRLRIYVLIPFWISIIVAEFLFVRTLLMGIIIGLVAVILTLVVLLVNGRSNFSRR
ncbi:MAG: YbaN family protein [Bacteroidales bacterium]|nr:YbaN family protein [Bacteroidales bacterium]